MDTKEVYTMENPNYNYERKTDCFNCQFCHDSEDGSRCACLVVAGGKPTPKEQVKAYLSGSAESCPVRAEIKYC